MCRVVYAVAMSGGVDSSTAAAILKSKNHEVFGITMDIHEHCAKAIESAKSVCKTLDIKHYILNARAEFERVVIDVFAEYYAKGLTPNPCALCNRDIKLNLLLKYARELGADYMATGHYVKMVNNGDGVYIQEAEDKKKDQTYFLALVSKENLRYVRFPLGSMKDKLETRKIAQSFGLMNFQKEDSQDICFITNGNYKQFLKRRYPHLRLFEPGEIKLYGTNQILGAHAGIANYTIGQRRGLGVSYPHPLFVTNIDSHQNQITVGPANALNCRQFSIGATNWLLDLPNSFNSFVKLRSLSPKTEAQITLSENIAHVTLCKDTHTPLSPGQICAVYDQKNRVLGGGIIMGSIETG